MMMWTADSGLSPGCNISPSRCPEDVWIGSREEAGQAVLRCDASEADGADAARARGLRYFGRKNYRTMRWNWKRGAR